MNKIINKLNEKAISAKCRLTSLFRDRKGDLATNTIGAIIIAVVIVGLLIAAINAFLSYKAISCGKLSFTSIYGVLHVAAPRAFTEKPSHPPCQSTIPLTMMRRHRTPRCRLPCQTHRCSRHPRFSASDGHFLLCKCHARYSWNATRR